MSAAALLALAISADPSPVRLGQDARAILRIHASSTPVLSASAGTVESLHVTGDGTYEAEYVPPPDGLPRVAIVSALAADELAWTAIPLWGAGDAVVKTRPGARISVDIGEQTFGPVVADKRGEAVVPVMVPPGVQSARHGKRLIPLHVPPSRTVHVAVGEPASGAGGTRLVSIYVLTVRAEGSPRSGAAIRLRATRGNVTALRERAPGVYEASLALSPAAAGEIRIAAALDEEPQFVAEAVLTLQRAPAPQAPQPAPVASDAIPAPAAEPLAPISSAALPGKGRSAALSAKIGALSNFSGFSAPLAGLEAAFRTRELGPHLSLALETDYAHRDATELLAAGVVGRSRVDLVTLHLSLGFRHEIGELNTLWAAAGPSAAAYWTAVGAVDGPEQRGFAIAPGFQGAIGAERRMGLAVPFVEARAGWITSPGLPMLTGPLRTVSLVAGVRLETR